MVKSGDLPTELHPVAHQRPLFEYQDQCDRFRIAKRTFDQQFYPYYNARLCAQMIPLQENAQRKWGSDVAICRLSQLAEFGSNGRRVAVMGILFKHLEKQPSILKEVSEEHQIFFDQNENRFTSDTDYMILQESSETIRLSGNVDVSSLVTGVVACVLGHEDEDGNSFAVEEICFAGPSVQPIQRIVQNEEPKYVMLVSGLGFSLNASEELVEAREMLFDLLTGRNDNEMNRKAARIVKLIVAGNCIGKNVRQTEANLIAKNGRQWSNRNNTAYTAPVVRQIDQWLFELGKHIEIDVLPGETDPASVMMPQQAFHPAILPKCSQLQSIRCTTNPYGSIIDRTQFLGTAGQPVNSIRVYSEIDDSIQIMCRQLEWSHLAPLAPDCLHSYPFKDKDPFIIESSPHVYFSGNQPNFNTMMFDQNGIQTRLLSLPEFETSFIAVLLDLNSLDVEICSFA